jgi:hypothetical protein
LLAAAAAAASTTEQLAQIQQILIRKLIFSLAVKNQAHNVKENKIEFLFYLLKSKCTNCISSDISTSTVA